MAAKQAIDVARLLSERVTNEPKLAAELLPLVYDALRDLAKRYMARERIDHTLQATALVHEAYERLVGRDVSWDGRVHFYLAAAQAMRDILIDHARTRSRQKRGGGAKRVPLDVSSVADLASDVDLETILALDSAICRLGGIDAQAERVVRLRFFAGLSVEEAAQALKVSPRTIKRSWSFARAWLARELQGLL
jgi:RNA polymerase sigma factor (TIGR02999 family)